MDLNLQQTFASPKKTESQEKPETAPQTAAATISDYAMIADQNLFHPERKIPEKKDEKQLPKPEFVLYGTLITDDASIAYMEDLKAPHNTAGRGKRQKAIHKGTFLSGFTLAEVHHDKVVMLRGEERIEIKITEQQHKKERSLAATAPPTAAKSDAPAPLEVRRSAEQPGSGRVEVKTSPSKTDKERQKIDKRSQRRNPSPQ